MRTLVHDKPLLLIFPFDLLSHYLRCLELAEAVRDRFQVCFVHSARHDKFVRRAGFETIECEQFDADTVMACARKFDFSWLAEDELRRVFTSQVAYIERLRPAAVLGDTAPTLKMAAEVTETPYIALMNGYMTKHYEPVRKIARVHPASRLEKVLPQKLFDQLVQWGEQTAFKRVHAPFKRIRQEYGLTQQDIYLDELEGDLNLICDLPMLFPQKTRPFNYHFIGPLFYSGSEPETELRAFLSNGKRSILVNVGSSGELNKFAFLNDTRLSRFNIVIAGNARKELQGGHIFAKPFINIPAILDKIDVVLCHGGNGSIYQALSAGKPLICAPSIFEQEWNVQRITDFNLGCALDGHGHRDRVEIIIEWMGRTKDPIFSEIKRRIDLDATKRTFRQHVESFLDQNRQRERIAAWSM